MKIFLAIAAFAIAATAVPLPGKFYQRFKNISTVKLPVVPPVDLYLISGKSIWKNQVRRTGFLVYFELDFYCLCSLQKSISKLIFGG